MCPSKTQISLRIRSLIIECDGRSMGCQAPNISSDKILRQGISEPLFYGDLVYTFKKIVGKAIFCYKFKKKIFNVSS